MTDPYATEAESAALIQKDTRTPYMKMLDQMMDVRGANEQGADVPKILYQIAVDLLAAMYHDTEEQP
jgi:hypothetical protein